MATSALKKITTEAKAIRRKHPNMTWKAAIKKAGAAYRSKAKPVKKRKVVGSAKKKAAPKKRERVGAYKVIERGESKSSRPSATYRTVRSKSGTFKGMRLAGVERDYTSSNIQPHLKFLRNNVVATIGTLEGKKLLARTKTEKNKIQKSISEYKQKLKKISDAIALGEKKR